MFGMTRLLCGCALRVGFVPFRFAVLLVPRLIVAVFLACGQLVAAPAFAADPVIPHRQTKPPNEPRPAAEAAKLMTVPPGFTVEVVACEPDLVNPVAMTFDERGRIWVTESLEYPRRSAGPGKDRIKILEDTDGDGRAEKVTIFAEGLNIPSGIAVGAGGVWVANAPDILFMQDTDGDDRADKTEVIVTGFGRDDTHELPNSLTWGPDGWLYGLNGVFNPSHIKYRGKQFDFTCALFRIHPRTRDFELFCEGTSNPWGVAFNNDGDAFISACVIDHLWHLIETAYYHRQGGAYPPHVWKLQSIVNYRHQMAAYCGIHWFDSDAYPEQYRDKLYMGNIHGGCINVDKVERNGATYRGIKDEDFLTANDAWFMPVVQKTGPDGCLYVLDWYDRYHCYQDANRDPAGIDRLKGRLYRVRYKDSPRAPKFDLTKETDDQLIARLASPNVFFRDIAQRVLWERNDPATKAKLEKLVLDDAAPRKARMHALWSLTAMGPLSRDLHSKLYVHKDPGFRAWCARALGNGGATEDDWVLQLQHAMDLAGDDDPAVVLQAVIAAPKMSQRFGDDGAATIFGVVNNWKSADPVLASIIWQNLLRLLPKQREKIVGLFKGDDAEAPLSAAILPRLASWLLSQGEAGAADIAEIMSWTLNPNTTLVCLELIAQRLQSGELVPAAEAALRSKLEAELIQTLGDASSPAEKFAAAAVLCHWKNGAAIKLMREAVNDEKNLQLRLAAVDAWASSRDVSLVNSIIVTLPPTFGFPHPVRRRVLDALTRYEDGEVAENVLAVYQYLEEDLKPAAVELLTSRVNWSNSLLDAIKTGKLSKDAVNVNQIRKLIKSGDKDLAKRVEETWGALRTDRNPQREQVVNKMRDLLRNTAGDPLVGQAHFARLCGQCHKIHGVGQDVGPDITVNGRASFEQLLSNVFDPSLVIGNAYRARTVVTTDGRVLTGLPVEESPQRVVLKLQGGKLETIARGDVEEIEISKLSLMPEGVEVQFKPEELVDLFAFLKLDKPPTDPAAKTLPSFSELRDRAPSKN
jgi:putative membrane-bound dehydrogenase-like protein